MSKKIYESTINKSRFNISMKYISSNTSSRPILKRQRKIMWFISQNNIINIGKMFFKLIRKHSLRSHRFSEIFN